MMKEGGKSYRDFGKYSYEVLCSVVQDSHIVCIVLLEYEDRSKADPILVLVYGHSIP